MLLCQTGQKINHLHTALLDLSRHNPGLGQLIQKLNCRFFKFLLLFFIKRLLEPAFLNLWILPWSRYECLCTLPRKKAAVSQHQSIYIPAFQILVHFLQSLQTLRLVFRPRPGASWQPPSEQFIFQLLSYLFPVAIL